MKLKIDFENDCEKCWESVYKILGISSAPSDGWLPVTKAQADKIKALVGRCKHGASAAAGSIFLWSSTRRGPKVRGTGKRVIISATVAPETAAKLRELAAKAGNMGRALDKIMEGK